MPAQVQFKTVSIGKTFLEGEFGRRTITKGTTDTECVLSVYSETKGKDSHEKYNDFLHNVVNFEIVIKKVY